MKTKATLKRSLVKTFGYRSAVVLANGVIAYAITGKMDVAIGFGSITAVVNTAMYFANERVWEKIEWGKQSII